jgi:hypothetical protein
MALGLLEKLANVLLYLSMTTHRLANHSLLTDTTSESKIACICEIASPEITRIINKVFSA